MLSLHLQISVTRSLRLLDYECPSGPGIGRGQQVVYRLLGVAHNFIVKWTLIDLCQDLGVTAARRVCRGFGEEGRTRTGRFTHINFLQPTFIMHSIMGS